MTNPELTLFYDGDCPFCQREVNWLRRRDDSGRVGYVDIAGQEFEPGRYGLGDRDVHARIHAVRGDGTVLEGMEVFRAVYGKIGLGWLMAPTGWPILRPIFDWLYRLFARNRVRLGKLFGRVGQATRDEECGVCAREAE
jgi:predicted DCC family thiol-disulfide oxidoreductase YuxK